MYIARPRPVFGENQGISGNPGRAVCCVFATNRVITANTLIGVFVTIGSSAKGIALSPRQSHGFQQEDVAQMATDETTLAQMNAAATLDQDFLFLRAKILEAAAVLDRIDRADGTVASDPRIAKLHNALEVLHDGSTDRAEQVQLIFSREYDPAWREDFEV